MNSRLLGISAIVTAVLTVSVGMFIFNSASSTITESTSTLSTMEIDAFNNQFVSYEGEQTGSNVKALIGRLIASANIYIDEPSKVPQVYIDKTNEENLDFIEATYSELDERDNLGYIEKLNEIRNGVETKHTYYVEFTFQDTGLIDYIQISYDPENPILMYKYR